MGTGGCAGDCMWTNTLRCLPPFVRGFPSIGAPGEEAKSAELTVQLISAHTLLQSVFSLKSRQLALLDTVRHFLGLVMHQRETSGERKPNLAKLSGLLTGEQNASMLGLCRSPIPGTAIVSVGIGDLIAAL